MKKIIGIIVAVLIFAAIATVSVSCFFKKADNNPGETDNNLREEVTIEAGSTINISDFFNDLPVGSDFVTDITGIDTNIPAVFFSFGFIRLSIGVPITKSFKFEISDMYIEKIAIKKLYKEMLLPLQ